jgi:Flp pilus assembly protein TadD
LLTSQDYSKYAVVLAGMDDRRAYENLCRESLKQFEENAKPHLAERMVKSFSLLPPSAGLLAELSPLAEKIAGATPKDANPNDWALPWQCLSLALFEYRRGNYAEAIDWGNRCLSFKGDSAMERVAGAHAILAVAHHQLGQAEQARSALAKSRELVEERWKTPFTVNADSRGWWYDWFIARTLEGEAAATIDPPAPATKK